MASHGTLSNHKASPTLICLVCGDKARGKNFNVLTCMPCKAFFRRHALQKGTEFKCELNNNCSITTNTRNDCPACRLKKCFSLGMDPNLIRSVTSKLKNTTQSDMNLVNKINDTRLSQPTSLTLLLKDRSLLTTNEWTILSNVIHAYDEQNIIDNVKNSLQEQVSLPPKRRSKQPAAFQLIDLCFSSMQAFMQHCSYFQDLPLDACRTILQNNLNGIGTYNSYFIASQTNVFNNEFHLATLNDIYGAEYMRESQRFTLRMESNGTLVKMMLIILGFSNNCSLLQYERMFDSTAATRPINSLLLVKIQDIFTTILWKYLVYQYGFVEAVQRLNRLVKNYLDILNRISELNSKQHMTLVNVLIEKTKNFLILNE